MEINVVIEDSPWRPSDIEWLFGPEEVVFITAKDMPNLLVKLGCFKSTSEARRAGREGPIPQGLTWAFKANKKTTIWIWNPSE